LTMPRANGLCSTISARRPPSSLELTSKSNPQQSASRMRAQSLPSSTKQKSVSSVRIAEFAVAPSLVSNGPVELSQQFASVVSQSASASPLEHISITSPRSGDQSRSCSNLDEKAQLYRDRPGSSQTSSRQPARRRRKRRNTSRIREQTNVANTCNQQWYFLLDSLLTF